MFELFFALTKCTCALSRIKTLCVFLQGRGYSVHIYIYLNLAVVYVMKILLITVCKLINHVHCF